MSFGFSVLDFVSLIQYANKLRREFLDAPGQFKAVSEEVRSLSIILQDADVLTDRSLSEAQVAELSAVASSCKSILEELNQTLDRYRVLERRQSDFTGKLKRVWKRVSLEPEDIRELRSRITSNVVMLEALNGRITRENTTKLVRAQDDTERNAILDWITPTEYASQHSDFIDRRQPGTGEWFLESPEYEKWVNRSERTLFSPGIPGSGKTILASIVVDDLLSRYQYDLNIAIAYIYLNFRQQDAQKVQHLLASLLKQLSRKRPLLPDSIKDMHAAHIIHGTRPSVAELSVALRSVVASFAAVYVVIDALDECRASDGCREDFLTELFGLQKTVGLQLFATSRWIPEITERFEGHVTLEIKASEQDVQRYVASTLSQLPRCVRDDPELQSEIQQGIVQAVDGMFLLAQLHLDSLKGKKSRKAVRTTLQNLPTGSEAYDFAYDEAMARIEAQLQDEKILAKQVLQWISTAVQPLKTVELEHALAIEIGESCLDEDNICAAEDMVSVCAGLVTIDPESGIVRLVHFTTQQYFDRSRSKWFGDANMDITKACMTYLLFDEFGNGPCENEDMVRQRRRSYPFYDYAAANWGHHAKQCGSDGVKLTDMYKHPQHVDSMSQALMAKIYWPLKVGFEDQFAKGMTGLHMAAFFHFQEMAEHYLNQGVPPDCPDSHQRTPLCWAAMQGDVGIVKLLIDTGKVDPLKKDNDSRSPFSWAAQGGFMEIVKLFLESNFDLDPNEVDDYEWSPLSWACDYGREEMVKLLLSLPNVNSNSTDNSGRTPLSWAAEKGHNNIVQMLIDATGGIDADSADSDGWTPLSWAADCGHNDVMQVLIDSVDARPEVIDGEGRATLSRVAQYGHNHTVKFLLDFPQVQVSRKHESGRTALSYAAQYGHYNVVKTLLEAAIGDVDLADNQGWTPLHWAAEFGHTSVMQLLMDFGKAEADARDKENRGPIFWAVINGHYDAVKMLLDRPDVDADAVYCDGKTALGEAAEQDFDEIVCLLIESGVENMNLRDSRGWTPLTIAAAAGSVKSVHVLLDEDGIDINSTDPDGKTALFWAAQAGHSDIVAILLQSPGTDVGWLDVSGRLPIHYAAEGSHFEVVNVLLESAKIDADARDGVGRTPLSRAASAENAAHIVEKLLSRADVDVNSRDNTGRTPAYWAAEAGRSEALDLILSSEKCSKPLEDQLVDDAGVSAIQKAYMEGRDNVVKCLARHGMTWSADDSGTA